MSHEVVERALALSKADEAIVFVTESSRVNLRWANNTLTTNGSTRERSVHVISVIGRSFGTRAANRFDGDELEAIVRSSEADAREAADAEDYSDVIAGDSDDDFTEPPEHTSTSVFRDFSADFGDALTAARAEGRSLFGYAWHDVTTLWLGTSKGLRLRHAEPSGAVEFTAKSGSARGSVWQGQATRNFADVSVPQVDTEMRRRLGWAERDVDLPAGRYETLLSPSAVADLSIYAYWSMSGRDAADGRTAFSKPGGGTRVGDRVAVPGLRMYSDPNDPTVSGWPFVVAGGSSAVTSVFDNGLALAATDWIHDGVLTSLLETRSSARSRGVAPTPPIDNLILDAGGTASLDQLVASTERGLLVNSLWYIREVDPRRLLLTGLTRDGVYLIEGGEVVGAVNNFRFNESPLELFGRLSEAGATGAALPREHSGFFSKVRMPAVRVPDFNMSTVSPAS